MTKHQTPPLARSKPEQTYAEHVEGVSKNVKEAAKSVVHYISKEEVAQFFAHTVYRASQYHDLGKLSAMNQDYLKEDSQNDPKKGRGGRLPLDHQDAGVANVNQNADSFAVSTLIKAHHAGLQNYHRERSRLYKGEKDSFAFRSFDTHTLDDTKKNLETYIETHEREVRNSEAEERVQASLQDLDVDALIYRLMLSCLVDADHRDSVGKDHAFPPRPACSWEKRLAKLTEYMSQVFQKELAGAKDSFCRQIYTACCEAEIKPIAYCDAPIDMDKIGTLMTYGLRAAMDNQHKHIFLVVRNDAVVTPIVDALREQIVLEEEEKSNIIAGYRANGKVGKDQGLGTLWRAPVVVLSEQEFWKSISASDVNNIRKLREIAGSTILICDCFAGPQRWKWPQQYKWLKILTEICGCRVLLQADTMVRFWEFPWSFSEKPHSILPCSLQQRIVEYEKMRVSFRFDEKKPICIDELGKLITRLTDEPGPRLVVLNDGDFAKQLEAELKSRKEIVDLALSPDELRCKIEQLKKKHTQNRVTLISAGDIPEKQGFYFAAGFVQIKSMSILLRVAQLMDNGHTPANLYTFDLRMPDVKILEDDYRCSIPLREMIKEDRFKNFCLSDLLTEAVRREVMLPPYDAREEKLKRAEQTMKFQEVDSLFSK